MYDGFMGMFVRATYSIMQSSEGLIALSQGLSPFRGSLHINMGARLNSAPVTNPKLKCIHDAHLMGVTDILSKCKKQHLMGIRCSSKIYSVVFESYDKKTNMGAWLSSAPVTNPKLKCIHDAHLMGVTDILSKCKKQHRMEIRCSSKIYSVVFESYDKKTNGQGRMDTFDIPPQ